MAKQELQKRLWIAAGKAIKTAETATTIIAEATQSIDWQKAEELVQHPLARRVATQAARRLPLTRQQAADGGKLIESGIKKLAAKQKDKKNRQLLQGLLGNEDF